MDAFKPFWRILCEAFPESEHRSQEEHLALLSHPRYELNPILCEGSVAGYWSLWKLDTFSFIEHIAVDSAYRGRGLGTQVFQELFSVLKGPLILEVERPVTPEAERRIAFYERLGLHLNRYPYVQPALQTGQPPVPMHLMSWPEPLNRQCYEAVRQELYRIVYHQETEN